MAQYRIGVIGCGNMGGALLKGLASLNQADLDLSVYTRTPSKVDALQLPSVRCMESANALAKNVDCLFLCVKPYQVAGVIEAIRSELQADTLLLSIAAGLSIDTIESYVGHPQAVVRCMPDTPALVGHGVFALAYSKEVAPSVKNRIHTLFSALGLAFELPEERFAAFSALIGAGPAYVFQLMQAFVQAGVTLGFGHKEARTMVEALFIGSAVMAKESEKHLINLRDDVCSPKGLTIDGVNELERRGVPGAVIDAVLCANARGLAMEKEK
ncbi:MAG: pyrroline-5-carboxylate reductase [Desulfovibrio sp.]|nr:pyrroline-5-carboxylate reductase [Desulfovibrio sp.]